MDRVTAQRVDVLARQAQSNLNDVLLTAQSNCTPEEFRDLRSTVGAIMGAIVTDVLQPLYAAHPEIIPTELR